jgi:nucleotidyltransferase substrate binding protein (TIGR01987 family)
MRLYPFADRAIFVGAGKSSLFQLSLIYNKQHGMRHGEMADTRWKQRFENFDRACALLERTATNLELSEAERGGLIQFFEMAFELSWKLLKDYLTDEGYDIKSPRGAIKQAFQNQLIANGQTWLMALEDRNLTSHTYDEETALRVEKMIREDYFPLLQVLRATFKQKVLHE